MAIQLLQEWPLNIDVKAFIPARKLLNNAIRAYNRAMIDIGTWEYCYQEYVEFIISPLAKHIEHSEDTNVIRNALEYRNFDCDISIVGTGS